MSHSSAKRSKKAPSLGRIARYLPEITKKAFEKFGFAYSEIVEHWPEIIGHDIARHTSPERIAWPRRKSAEQGKPHELGVLTIRVDGPRAVEIQHQTSEIIEAINRYYGYRAIGDIKLIQGPLPDSQTELKFKTNKKPEGHASPPKQEANLDEIEGIENQDLKSALSRLQHGIKTKRE